GCSRDDSGGGGGGGRADGDDENDAWNGRDSNNVLSKLDVIGLLLLLLNRRHSTPVTALLDNLSRRPERLPVSSIVTIAERSGEPPWTSLAKPVLELGLWAAMGASSTVAARAKGGRTGSSSGGSSSKTPARSAIAAATASASASSTASLLMLRKAGSRILLAVF
ncbi:unnamed protein product, partial [Sphacelaria rigidula]